MNASSTGVRGTSMTPSCGAHSVADDDRRDRPSAGGAAIAELLGTFASAVSSTRSGST